MNQKIKLIFRLSIIIIAFSTTAFRCGKPKTDCDNVVCTQDFRTFTITTVDAQKNSIIPDEVVITNVATGMPITTFTQNTSNTFTVFSDGNKSLLTAMNVAQSIKVEALVNNVIKGTTTLQFAKDCCHVLKISGADSLVVN
jgi:phosphoribosylaminoimidazole-succinocarboxamide synthase